MMGLVEMIVGVALWRIVAVDLLFVGWNWYEGLVFVFPRW